MVLIKECRVSRGSRVSVCRRMSIRRGGSTAALCTCLLIVASGSRLFRESIGSEWVLISAARDGVQIDSVVSVSWRWSMFSCM